MSQPPAVERSCFTVRTRATGLLARLAHDLEIEAPGGVVKLDMKGESTWTAEACFLVGELRVKGVVRHGQLDRTVLSRGEIEEIEQKIRTDVLVGREVLVRARGEGASAAALTVIAPAGEQQLQTRLDVERDGDGARIVRGRCQLSLRALGVAPIKGPLGAFRVHDEVEVVFEVSVKG